MIWDSKARFILALVLLILWLPYYLLAYIAYMRKRNHEYIAPRYPLLISCNSLWFFLTTTVILLQEVINNYQPNNAADYSYTFPCLIVEFTTCFCLISAVAGNVRQQHLYVKFNYSLRQQAKYRKFLDPKFLRKMIALGVVLACIMFTAQAAVGRAAYRDISANPHCDLFEFSYFWMVIGIIAMLFMLRKSKQTLAIHDRFGAGREAFVVIFSSSFGIFLLVVIYFTYQFTGQRNFIDTNYLPFQYLWILFTVFNVWVYHYKPLIYIYYKENQLTTRTDLSGITISSPLENALHLGHLGNKCLEATQIIDLPTAPLMINQSSSNSDNFLSQQPANNNNFPQQQGGSLITDVRLLLFILEDKELTELMQNHAKRSLCGEVVEFHRAANRLVVQSQQFRSAALRSPENSTNHYNNNCKDKNNNDRDTNESLIPNNNNKADFTVIDNIVPLPEGYTAWLRSCFLLYSEYIIENSPFELNLPASLRMLFKDFLLHYRDSLLAQEAERFELSNAPGRASEISQASHNSSQHSPNSKHFNINTGQQSISPQPTFSGVNGLTAAAKGVKLAPLGKLSTVRVPGHFKRFGFAKSQRQYSLKSKEMTKNTVNFLLKMNTIVVLRSWPQDSAQVVKLLSEALYECVNLIKVNLLKTFLNNPVHLEKIKLKLSENPAHFQLSATNSSTTTAHNPGELAKAGETCRLERASSSTPANHGNYAPLLIKYHSLVAPGVQNHILPYNERTRNNVELPSEAAAVACTAVILPNQIPEGSAETLERNETGEVESESPSPAINHAER
jgi:hypothetical protein